MQVATWRDTPEAQAFTGESRTRDSLSIEPRAPDRAGLAFRRFQQLRELPGHIHLTLFLLLFGLVAAPDLVLDHDLSLYALYLIPASYAIWFLGARWAYASCVASVGVWIIDDLIHEELRRYTLLSYWNLATKALVILIVAAVIERLKAAVEKWDELKRLQIERELELAHEVQLRLLPSVAPSYSDLDVSYVYQPARVVGGDFYDFVPLDNERLGIVVADIAGKGLSSALLMASLKGLIHNAPELHRGELSRFAMALNTSLFDLTDTNRYATVFLAIVDMAHGTLEYVNGGHNPPLLFSVSCGPGLQYLDHAGLPLGLFSEAVYEHQRVRLCAGDVLVIYTDGVTDAQNSAGDMFGNDRLREVISCALTRPAAEISDRIRTRLQEFVRGTAPFDDITLVVVKRKQGQSRYVDGVPTQVLPQRAPSY